MKDPFNKLNWAVMNKIQRSFQPSLEILSIYKQNGVNSVLNLRSESEESKAYCEKLGLKYFYCPIEDWGLPSRGTLLRAVAILQNPSNHGVLVHCMGGIGRTGTILSAYRILELGYSAEEAINLSDIETPILQMTDVQKDFLKSL